MPQGLFEFRVMPFGMCNTHDEHRILSSNVSHYLVKGNSCSTSVSLVPHEVVQVGCQLTSMAPSHQLQLCFKPAPIGLDVLGSSGIHKLK